MIKLNISELEFYESCNSSFINSYPIGVQHKDIYINPDLIESVVLKKIGFYVDKIHYRKNWLGNNVTYYEPTEYLRGDFYELTMSSGEKFLTMDKLDFIGEFGELR